MGCSISVFICSTGYTARSALLNWAFAKPRFAGYTAQFSRWRIIGDAGSRMVSLTTTQRDLLNLLLTTEPAVSVSTIGEALGLTPRQIHYSLRELKPWLSQRSAPL